MSDTRLNEREGKELFSSAAEEEETLFFEAVENGGRLDAFVAEKAEVSRSRAQKWIDEGAVSVNGKTAAKNHKLKIGDGVEILLPPNEDCEAKPENIPLDVRYEDEHIIVVNKPCGMVVHPAPGHSHGTLVNALLYHCGDSLSGIGGVNRPGIVHRIDRDTSGLICAAKSDGAHVSLAAQLADHTMHREYRLITVGALKEDEGLVDAPIGRHPTDRKKMAVIKQGDKKARHAVTHYTVLERFPGFTYAKAVLETGRTHQIRVHMAYVGHPLMGDTVYGGGHTVFEKHNAPLLEGQMLHATALILRHPVTGETMRFESDLPENFLSILHKLRKL